MRVQSSQDTLQLLAGEGVSLFLGGFARGDLAGGRLRSALERREIRGMFWEAEHVAPVLAGEPYRPQLAELVSRRVPVPDAGRALLAYDARWAADLLAGRFAATEGYAGLVSAPLDLTEVRTAADLVERAVQLAADVNRPHLLVDVPATAAWLPAISGCLAAGISVRATRVLSPQRCRQVVEAYCEGLERAAAAGRDLAALDLVVSFDVGAVDTVVDAALERLPAGAGARSARGIAGVAAARLAHQGHEKALDTARWAALADLGARPPRLAWNGGDATAADRLASWYLPELLTWGVVHTLPLPALDSVLQGTGLRGDLVTGSYAAAHAVLEQLADDGVVFEQLVQDLECETVAAARAACRRWHAAVGAALPS